jgi:3-hydroxyisobutyrate dehydrogenase
MLPDGKIVRKVLCGTAGSNDGVLAGLAAGSLVIDMSSSAPVGTRELGAELAVRGVALVDAPVSGGVKRAVDGTLAIMAGGAAADIERCRPLLAAMGRDIFPTGPLGSGHAMKALNNYVSAAGLAAAAEAVLVGRRFGLDPAVMTDILNASTGRNNATENKLKQFILSRRYSAGFSLGLMAKDLRTALETAEATATPAPLAAACIALWNAAEARLGAAADHTAIAQYLETLIEEG